MRGLNRYPGAAFARFAGGTCPGLSCGTLSACVARVCIASVFEFYGVRIAGVCKLRSNEIRMCESRVWESIALVRNASIAAEGGPYNPICSAMISMRCFGVAVV